VTSPPDQEDAWLSLNQAGRLLDREGLATLPEPVPVSRTLPDRLRDVLAEVTGVAEGEALTAVLDLVLEELCALVPPSGAGAWRKGPQVGSADAVSLVDGTQHKPRRILELAGAPALAVFVSRAPRVGMHKGRRDVAQAIEYLRRSRLPLGIVTNGREWRLVFADPDNLAWVEWASDRLLEGDVLSPAAELLRRVLSLASLTSAQSSSGEPGPSRLLLAIRHTRRGQARLSKKLGEHVRGAVELLLTARRPVLELHWDVRESKAIYNAACHFVMRLVVVLFAEARELLPVDSPVYHQGYGLKGLLEALERAGKARRDGRNQAWPRLLALFRLLHRGSPHPGLVVPTYGGDLFRPGDGETSAQERALACIEAVTEPPNDEVVYRLLTLLTRTTERVREGSGFRTVAAPVDFTELTSEYIGILYEGLLDYELHRASAGPVVFLAIGDQPALPLDRLETMSDKQLIALVEKAKVKKTATNEGDSDDKEDDDDTADDEESSAGEADAEPDVEPEPAVPEDAPVDDARIDALRRALTWAEQAAVVAKLVRAPRGKRGADDPAWRADVEKAAKQLIARKPDGSSQIVLPGELYVVRWGGTRKGAGTFYTRPQLTLPTARCTLEPLLRNTNGTIKTPEEILALKVCDPAMGSGSFLVASLRVLTEAVVAALHQHRRLIAREGSELVRIECALLPDADRDQSADGVEAIVRRAVVEHCLYGVDRDPLAVELARVSLWVETLDKRLPFTFLDHKLRPGDALLGTWLDRFRDYPLLAWWRQSPDEKWRGVTHEGDVWAGELKALRASIVEEQRKLLSGEARLPFTGTSDDELKAAIERVRDLYRQLRKVPASQPDKRAELWKNRVVSDPAIARVKESFDTWCALWFWPLDRLELAPRPMELLAPSDTACAVVREVAAQKRFFHWELEFPDVFTEKGAGFDAIVANPPWDTLQPQSKEFFSARDPLYRSYGKQDALRWQREEFQRDASFERKWLDHIGTFKDASHFVRHAAEPFGDADDTQGRPLVGLVPRKADDTRKLHRKWTAERGRKSGLSDPEHPFRRQGEGKAYSYKLFVEQAHALLKAHGQLGLITPSGLYTDKGAVDLRKLLLDRCAWRWLYGFENRNKVFDIDSRFKFAVIIAEKGGKTEAISAAFMRHDVDDWAEAKEALAYPAERIHAFSSKSLSILEIRTARDLEVVTKLYANGVLLGDDGLDGWGIKYAQGDFNMTTDSKLFVSREKAEEAGYKADAYGRWIGRDGDVLLPLYQGGMLWHLDPFASHFAGGSGHGVRWERTKWGTPEKRYLPQYLVHAQDCQPLRSTPVRLAFRYIANPTNERTMVAAAIPAFPAGHTVGIGMTAGAVAVAAVLSSYAFDYALRTGFGGSGGAGALDPSKLTQFPVPTSKAAAKALGWTAHQLNAASVEFSAFWAPAILELAERSWKRLWAVTAQERLRLRCIVDAIVAATYGLARDDLGWILRDCDHPKVRLANKSFCRTLDPKGFWRVNKTEDPELRHTVLTLVAFDALERLIAEHGGDRDAGIAAFQAQNDGEGWMLPESLRLADHGLGHDERATKLQPVAGRLGPRFLDWQLVQTPEESWAECEKHARAILGDAAVEARFGKEPKPKTTTIEGRIEVRPTITGTVEVKPATPQLGFMFSDAPKHSATNGPAALEPMSMTISNIRLKNFRNWTAEHWDKGVALKPITLVLGRNSAGKTSILQPLRLLKQTLEATDAGTHLLLDGTKADGVNLGAFADVVHDHDVKESVGIGFDVREKGISVDVTFRQVNERPVIESLTYRVRDEKVEVTRTPNAYQLQSPRFRLPNWDGAKDAHEPKKTYEPGRAIELSDQSLTDLGPTLGPVVRSAIVAAKETFATFHYLGPLRPPPAREVTWSQQDPKFLGSTGTETIQALISNETGKDKGALKTAVSEWLKRLDLAEGIEISRVGKTLLYQIEVVRGGRRSNLADVGYGVSQVLPVIVLLHFVPEGSVILCEDPEAHLHPMAQSALADLFVEAAKKRKLQVLIETHSEHFFRRLQVLMASAKVTEHDCALYYVERDDPSAKLIKLRADEFGRIQNWPENLFGDAVGEAGRQMREMIKRLQTSEGKS